MDFFRMSFSASILIVVVVIIRTIALYKLPKRTFLILWGITVLRLLIPFSIPSRFSVYTVFATLKNPFVQATVATNPNTGTIFPLNAMYMLGMEEAVGAGISVASISAIEIVWLTGMCACALFFIVTYVKCRREFKMSLPVENEDVACWVQEHPLCRPVQIRQTDRIKIPLTYGVLHPVILLPKKVDWTNEKRLHYLLTHEYMHIRHYDALAKLVLTAALCIHWHNPFVWIMYILANRDIELSCDEAVVRSMGENIKSVYALILIGLEETKDRLSPLVNYFSKNAIEERIISIMKTKKASLIGIIAAFVIVVGVTTAFATSPAVKTDSLLKKVTRATTEQSRDIKNKLEEFGIDIDSIGLSSNAIIEGMDENWEAYDIISKDGKEYLLILRKFDRDFTAILDSENNVIDGMVDNGVLPKYFNAE